MATLIRDWPGAWPTLWDHSDWSGWREGGHGLQNVTPDVVPGVNLRRGDRGGGGGGGGDTRMHAA